MNRCFLVCVLLAGLAVLAPAKPADDAKRNTETRKKRCTACGLMTNALATAASTKREELDQFKEAKEEAIGRVQKAQTRRWLKQEYGSALYAAVEDAMDKVCALPQLAKLKRECEWVREDREDDLARAAIDGTGTAFCQAQLGDGGACTEERLAEVAREEAQRRVLEAAGKEKAAQEDQAAAAAAKGRGPAVRRLTAATYSDAVLDEDKDVLVYIHAAPASEPANAKPAPTPLWKAFESLARAARASAALNETLALARVDVTRHEVPLADNLFDPSLDKCVPAVLLFPSKAKEEPRLVVSACDGSVDDAPPEAAVPDTPAGERAMEEAGQRLVERLRTYATSAPKASIAALDLRPRQVGGAAPGPSAAAGTAGAKAKQGAAIGDAGAAAGAKDEL